MTTTQPISPQISSQGAWGYQDYDRNGAVNLPPYWNASMATFGKRWGGTEFVMRYMMQTDEILAGTYLVLRALVCEGEHNIVGSVADPGTMHGNAKARKRFARSEKAREAVQDFIDGLSISTKVTSGHLCEAIPYGSKLCEVEWDTDKGLRPVYYSPKPRVAYEWIVDRSNRVQGVRPYGGSADTVKIPLANMLWLTCGGMDDDPNGGPALAHAYDCWYRKGNFLRDEVISSAQSGGSSLKITQDYPPTGYEYVSTVSVETKDSEGNTVLEERASGQVAAEQAANIRTGKVAYFPPGYDADFMQGTAASFREKISACDSGMIVAFVGAARMTQEAKNGSKADSSTAEGVAETVRDYYRGLLSAAWERFFRVFIELTLGPDYLDVVPRYDIVTEERQDLAAIGTFLQGNIQYLNLDQKNYLADLMGLPHFDEDQEVQATDTVDEKTIAQQDAAATEKEVAQFAARFPVSSLATFATRLEITNGAAQRRIGGKRGAVRSADRQFRSLVTRLTNGTITESDFIDRFSHTLQVAHERAYTIGFQHGGGEELTAVADEYIASTVASEGEYAANLASGLADGTISKKAGLARARQYANRVRGTANEGFREASVGSGETIDWLLGGNEFHCSQCPEYASMSPWEPTELFATPGSGDTPCRSNCLCRLKRSDGREGFGPVDFSG